MLKPSDLTKLVRENPRILPRKEETITAGTTREGAPTHVIIDRGPLADPKDLNVSEVLCSTKDFAAGELADGRFVAFWPGHADVCEDLESLKAVLNRWESSVLLMKINNWEYAK